MNTAKRFFSLEGIDGSGKSTQIDMLISALESEGYSVVKLREPGGAKISERIREILLDASFKGIMADKTELLLYNAARAQVIHEIIQRRSDYAPDCFTQYPWRTAPRGRPELRYP